MKRGDLVTASRGTAARCALWDKPSSWVSDDPGYIGDIVPNDLCLVLDVLITGPCATWLMLFCSRTKQVGWIEEDNLSELT